MTKKKSSIMRKLICGGTIAGILTVGLLSATQPGQAAVGRIREFFEPEKTIIEVLEGTEETKEVVLKESEAGYIIYFDEEYYSYRSENGVDRITPVQKSDTLPDVYMEISQIKDKTPGQISLELEQSLKNEFATVLDVTSVSAPLNATLLYGEQGSSWDDVVVRYYVVDNTKGGAFVIKQQFFLEAAEGHGARFDNILKEFKVVDIE